MASVPQITDRSHEISQKMPELESVRRVHQALVEELNSAIRQLSEQIATSKKTS
jgi:hypothetical protein